MALIAARDIYIGRTLVHRKGAPVPGAVDWPYPVLRAALDSGDLEDRDGDVARKHDWRQRLFDRSSARTSAVALSSVPGGSSEPQPASEPQPLIEDRAKRRTRKHGG